MKPLAYAFAAVGLAFALQWARAEVVDYVHTAQDRVLASLNQPHSQMARRAKYPINPTGALR